MTFGWEVTLGVVIAVVCIVVAVLAILLDLGSDARRRRRG